MKNLRVTVNGTAYNVQVEEINGNFAPAATAVQTTPAAAAIPVPAAVAAAPAPAPEATPAPAATSEPCGEVISAPMPGTIVSVEVQPGKNVKKGDVLVILEAMKMENEIMAPHDAVVAGIHVNKGDSVNSGTPLVSLK